MSLAFPDFQLATVENVFHSLVAREYIGPEHLSSYYLSFRSWRSKPLPMKSTFLDLGIQRHATLILCLRRQGSTSQHQRHNPIRAAKTNHRYVQDQMATDHSVLPSRKRARSESSTPYSDTFLSDAETSTEDDFSPKPPVRKRTKTAQKQKQPAKGKENRGLAQEKHESGITGKQGATPVSLDHPQSFPQPTVQLLFGSLR